MPQRTAELSELRHICMVSQYSCPLPSGEPKESSLLLTITQGVEQVVASVGVLKESSELLVLWSEVYDLFRTSRWARLNGCSDAGQLTNFLYVQVSDRSMYHGLFTRYTGAHLASGAHQPLRCISPLAPCKRAGCRLQKATTEDIGSEIGAHGTHWTPSRIEWLLECCRPPGGSMSKRRRLQICVPSARESVPFLYIGCVLVRRKRQQLWEDVVRQSLGRSGVWQ